MRLVIDPTRCHGHGTCAQLLDEYIRLDKWHYPVIAKQKVSAGHGDLLLRAAQLCPELAISIVDD